MHRIHRKYFCGETAQRTDAQSKTEKKRQKVESNKNMEEEEEDDEDEIAKQKKMLKTVSKKSSVKTTKTSQKSSKNEKLSKSGKDMKSTKANSGKLSRKEIIHDSDSIFEDDSDDFSDDVEIKKSTIVKTSKIVDAKSLKKPISKTLAKNSKHILLSEDESSEDEIDRQKRLIKKMAQEKKEQSRPKLTVKKVKSRSKGSVNVPSKRKSTG